MDVVRERRESRVRGVARAAIVCCLGVAAAGCRTGSWVSKPSWMTFGQKTPDAGPLASQPAIAGTVQKPSATAKPYPTTSTPDGYSLPDATAQASVAPGAAPAAVTYGVTPPPATETAAAATIPPAAGSTAAIAPQVGPYAPSAAALPPEVNVGNAPESTRTAASLAAVPTSAVGAATPLADPLPSVSTAPPPWAAAPTTPPSAAVPPQRYADARAASPAWSSSAAEPLPVDGRYAASGTSRFGGGAVPAAAASMLPSSPPPAPFSAPPAELPPPVTSPASSSPTAPLRRPDPDYRPGGTSSYRPARSSLAAEPPSGVQPASFETAAPGVN